MLAGHINTIEHCEAINNKNGDALSRLALSETVNILSNPSEIMFISNNKDLSVTSNTIAKCTIENPVTKQNFEWVLHG